MTLAFASATVPLVETSGKSKGWVGKRQRNGKEAMLTKEETPLERARAKVGVRVVRVLRRTSRVEDGDWSDCSNEWKQAMTMSIRSMTRPPTASGAG
jgi:hypothetical protein